MKMALSRMVMMMAKKIKADDISFASVADAIECEGKARRRMGELRLIYQRFDKGWELFNLLVAIGFKQVPSSYLGDWFNLEMGEDIKDYSRCIMIMRAVAKYYDEHGLEPPKPFYDDGGGVDVIVNPN